MKITMEVDCTPEGARRFFRLPDVASLHDEALAVLRGRVAEAAAATTPEAVARLWMPFLPQVPEAFLRGMGGAAARPPREGGEDERPGCARTPRPTRGVAAPRCWSMPRQSAPKKASKPGGLPLGCLPSLTSPATSMQRSTVSAS